MKPGASQSKERKMTHDAHTIPAIERRRGNPAELNSKMEKVSDEQYDAR